MTDRYIRYEDAVKALDKYRCYGISCRQCEEKFRGVIGHECRTLNEKRELKKLVVEAKPVRQGRWVKMFPDARGQAEIFKCSECRTYSYLTFHVREAKCEYSFCPNCGAKMDGEQDGE